MAAFNLTAEINLRGPANLKKVAGDIKRELSNIQSNVTLKVSAKAAKNIAGITQNVEALNQALIKAQSTSSKLSADLSKLGSSSNSVSKNIKTVASSTQDVTTSAKEVSASMSKASSEMAEFGKQSALAVRRFAAFSAPTALIYGFTRAFSNSISEFIKFDRSLVRLQQTTKGFGHEITAISDEITNLSTSLGVSSSDLLDVSVVLAQAGLSAEQTKTALEALAKTTLSPSFENITDTTEGAIAAMRQFGLGAKDLEGALSSINAVAAAFAVESGDIIAAIQRTGGVFASASKGVSEGSDALNEFIAIFTSVRQTSRESAETIATGLRTIFTRIQRGTTIQALKEYGVELQDLEGKFVGPYEAIKRLSEGLGRLDPRDLSFNKIIEELGGFRQIGKVIPLIQQFAVAQDALSVAQQGQGSLSANAIQAQKALAVQFTKTRQEFDAFVRSLGQTDTFKNLVSSGLSLTRALIKLAGSFKPLMPYLAVIGGLKGASALSQFAGGFLGGIKKSSSSGSKSEDEDLLGSLFNASKSKSSSGDVVTSRLEGLLSENNNALNSVTNALASLENTIGSKSSMTASTGGKVLGFNGGGVVPGSGRGDKVRAMLEPGEVVMSNQAAEKYGRGNLARMNKYASGGKTMQSIIKAPSGSPLLKEVDNDENIQLKDVVIGNIKRVTLTKEDIEKFYKQNISKIPASSGSFAKDMIRSSLSQTRDDGSSIPFRFAKGFAFEDFMKLYLENTGMPGYRKTKDKYDPIDFEGPGDPIEVRFRDEKTSDATMYAKMLRYQLTGKNSSSLGFTKALNLNPPADAKRAMVYEIDSNFKQELGLKKGGIIQKFPNGSPGGIQLDPGRGKEGPRASYLPRGFEILNDEEFAAFSKKAYKEAGKYGGPGWNMKHKPPLPWPLSRYHDIIEKIAFSGIEIPIAKPFDSSIDPKIIAMLEAQGDVLYGTGYGDLAKGQPAYETTALLPFRYPKGAKDPKQRKMDARTLRKMVATAGGVDSSSLENVPMEALLKYAEQAPRPPKEVLEATIARYQKDPATKGGFLKRFEQAAKGGEFISGKPLLDEIPDIPERLVAFRKSLEEKLLEAKDDEKLRKSITDKIIKTSNAIQEAKDYQKDILPTVTGRASHFAWAMRQAIPESKNLANGGLVQQFMAGSVGGVDTPVGKISQDILDRIKQVGGSGYITANLPYDQVQKAVAQASAVVPKVTSPKKLLTLPSLKSLSNGSLLEEIIEPLLSQAEEIKEAELAQTAGQKQLNEQAAAGKGLKFGLASLYGPSGQLGYSSVSNAKELLGKDGTTKYLTQLVRKSLPTRYADAVSKIQQDVADLPARGAEQFQYTDIFGTGGPLAFDFDDTLVKHADIFTPSGEIDKPGYSDLDRVRDALQDASLTRLGQELAKRLIDYPALMDNIRILTARPQSNAELLASKLASLGLPIPASKITGVSGGLNKVHNLSELETLIDDNLENFQSVTGAGKRAYLYREPQPISLANKSSKRAIAAIEGYDLEEIVKLLGVGISSDDANPLRPIDYPSGLGSSASIWGFDPNMPTDTKRTNDGSAVRRLWAEAQKYIVQNFAFGGRSEGPVEEKLLEQYRQILQSVLPSEFLTADGYLKTSSGQAESISIKPPQEPKRTLFDRLMGREAKKKGAFYKGGTRYKFIRDNLYASRDSLPQEEFSEIKAWLDKKQAEIGDEDVIDLSEGIGKGALAHETFHDIQGYLLDYFPETHRKLQSSVTSSKDDIIKWIEDASGKSFKGYKSTAVFPENVYESALSSIYPEIMIGADSTTSSLQRFAKDTAVKAGGLEAIPMLLEGVASGDEKAQKILSNIFGSSGLNRDFWQTLPRFNAGGIAKKSKNFGQIALRTGNRIQATYIKEGQAGQDRAGQVIADKIDSSVYAVQSAAATGGYGPRLYDVVMEAATAQGAMLVSDRSTVSSDAKGVWDVYFSSRRPDVKKTTPLPVKYWVSNNRLLDPKLYGRPETWPPFDDPAWVLQTGYSKGPDLINSPDVVRVDPVQKAIANNEPYLPDTLSRGGFASGGSVPAMVSNGEAFVPPQVAKKIGYANLDRMNQADRNGMGKYAGGGGISVFKGPGSGTSDSIGPIGLPQGSYVIRQKATKALGLNKGGGVGSIKAFAEGGKSAPGDFDVAVDNFVLKILDATKLIEQNIYRKSRESGMTVPEAKAAADFAGELEAIDVGRVLTATPVYDDKGNLVDNSKAIAEAVGRVLESYVNKQSPVIGTETREPGYLAKDNNVRPASGFDRLEKYEKQPNIKNERLTTGYLSEIDEMSYLVVDKFKSLAEAAGEGLDEFSDKIKKFIVDTSKSYKKNILQGQSKTKAAIKLATDVKSPENISNVQDQIVSLFNAYDSSLNPEQVQNVIDKVLSDIEKGLNFDEVVSANKLLSNVLQDAVSQTDSLSYGVSEAVKKFGTLMPNMVPSDTLLRGLESGRWKGKSFDQIESLQAQSEANPMWEKLGGNKFPGFDTLNNIAPKLANQLGKMVEAAGGFVSVLGGQAAILGNVLPDLYKSFDRLADTTLQTSEVAQGLAKSLNQAGNDAIGMAKLAQQANLGPRGVGISALIGTVTGAIKGFGEGYLNQDIKNTAFTISESQQKLTDILSQLEVTGNNLEDEREILSQAYKEFAVINNQIGTTLENTSWKWQTSVTNAANAAAFAAQTFLTVAATLALVQGGKALFGNKGGFVNYYAKGDIVGRGNMFKPKGTDTVPAMLTRGEFVVNARSAKANGALLESINNSNKTVSKSGVAYASRGGWIQSDTEAGRPSTGYVGTLSDVFNPFDADFYNESARAEDAIYKWTARVSGLTAVIAGASAASVAFTASAGGSAGLASIFPTFSAWASSIGTFFTTTIPGWFSTLTTQAGGMLSRVSSLFTTGGTKVVGFGAGAKGAAAASGTGGILSGLTGLFTKFFGGGASGIFKLAGIAAVVAGVSKFFGSSSLNAKQQQNLLLQEKVLNRLIELAKVSEIRNMSLEELNNLINQSRQIPDQQDRLRFLAERSPIITAAQRSRLVGEGFDIKPDQSLQSFIDGLDDQSKLNARNIMEEVKLEQIRKAIAVKTTQAATAAGKDQEEAARAVQLALAPLEDFKTLSEAQQAAADAGPDSELAKSLEKAFDYIGIKSQALILEAVFARTATKIKMEVDLMVLAMKTFETATRSVAENISNLRTTLPTRLGTKLGQGLQPVKLDESSIIALKNLQASTPAQISAAVNQLGPRLGMSPQGTQFFEQQFQARKIVEESLPRILADIVTQTASSTDAESRDTVTETIDKELKPLLAGVVEPKYLDTLLTLIKSNIAQQTQTSRTGGGIQALLSNTSGLNSIIEGIFKSGEGFIQSSENTYKALETLIGITEKYADTIVKIIQTENTAFKIAQEGAISLKRAFGEFVSLEELNSVFENEILSLTRGQNGQRGTLDPAAIGQRLDALDTRRSEILGKLEAGPADLLARGMTLPKFIEGNTIELQSELAGVTEESTRLSQALNTLANSGVRTANALTKIQELRRQTEAREQTFLDVLKNINNPQWIFEFQKQTQALVRVMSGQGTRLDIPAALEALQRRLPTLDPAQALEERAKFVEEVSKIAPQLGALFQKGGVLEGAFKTTPTQQMQGLTDEYNRLLDEQVKANLELSRRMRSGALEISETVVSAAKEFASIVHSSIVLLSNLPTRENPPKPPKPPAPQPAAGAGLSRGGVVYASKGKFINFAPKGTDTVPAMLTPGEFVVNKNAAQKNLPLLKSINSGTNSGKTSVNNGVLYAAGGGEALGKLVTNVYGLGRYISRIDEERGVNSTSTRSISSAVKSFADLSQVGSEAAMFAVKTFPNELGQAGVERLVKTSANLIQLKSMLSSFGYAAGFAGQTMSGLEKIDQGKKLWSEGSIGQSLAAYGGSVASGIKAVGEVSNLVGSKALGNKFSKYGVILGMIMDGVAAALEDPSKKGLGDFNSDLTSEQASRLYAGIYGGLTGNADDPNTQFAYMAYNLSKLGVPVPAATLAAAATVFVDQMLRTRNETMELQKTFAKLRKDTLKSVLNRRTDPNAKFDSSKMKIPITTPINRIDSTGYDSIWDTLLQLPVLDIMGQQTDHSIVGIESMYRDALVKNGSPTPKTDKRLLKEDIESLDGQVGIYDNPYKVLKNIEFQKSSGIQPRAAVGFKSKGLRGRDGRELVFHNGVNADSYYNNVQLPAYQTMLDTLSTISDIYKHNASIPTNDSQDSKSNKSPIERITESQRYIDQLDEFLDNQYRSMIIPSAFTSSLTLLSAMIEGYKAFGGSIYEKIQKFVSGMPQTAASKTTSPTAYYSQGSLVNFKPKGTDTVPAMLTPGEFVVNKSATQRNLPLLQSINNGYYSSGGQVQYFSRGGKNRSKNISSNNGVSIIGIDSSNLDAAFNTFGNNVGNMKKVIDDFGKNISQINTDYFRLAALSISDAGRTLAVSAASIRNASDNFGNRIVDFNRAISSLERSIANIPSTISLQVSGGIPIFVEVNGGDGLDENLEQFKSQIYQDIAQRLNAATDFNINLDIT